MIQKIYHMAFGKYMPGLLRHLLKSAVLLAVVFLFPIDLYSATISSVKVNGLTLIEQGELLDILGLEEGGIIDETRVRNGIKRTFLKGLFDDISVVTDDRDPAEVVITVTERDVIRSIKLEGDLRLSAKTVSAALIFREGETMRYDLIGEAEKQLKAVYAISGYPYADVTITADNASVRGSVSLKVVVNTGQPQMIKEVKISPNERISASDFKVAAGDIYDQNRINQELQRIKDLLRKEGYFHPAAGPYSYLEGTLFVVVDPGRHLSISLEGNSEISSKRLEKEIPFFELETFNDDIVDEAVSRMLSVYRKEGFIYAQVAPVIVAGEREISAGFFVFEGRRINVRTISFSGASYPDPSLKGVIQTREGGYYDPGMTGQDAELLKEFYNALGYLDADVREIDAKVDEDSGYADIRVVVDEGLRTSIASINISGVSKELGEKLLGLISLRTGDAYNEVDISDARFRILDYYANEGYANMDVRVIRRIEERSAHITFSVIEGKKLLIGKTVITGNRRTKYAVIRRDLAHNEGDAYNFKSLGDIRQGLYRLGLFTDVDIEAYDSSEDRRDLLIRLKEGNAGAFEFGFGYADYEKLRGFAEVSYRNLFGMNRQGLMRVELSSLENRLIMQYHEPWFLGRPLPLRVLLIREDKTEITIPGREVRYRLERYSVSAGTEKKLSPSVKAEIYYEFSLVRTSDLQPDVILSKEDIGTMAISAIRPAIVYDTRNDPFEPSEGVVAGLGAKFASPILFSETNFAKFSMYASFFHRLHRQVVLALSARGGIAFGFGATDELPIVERFFLGGRSTVRGYEQDMLGPKGLDGNPTGGNAFAMGSIELRTNVGKGVSIVPFFDFGNVWIKASDAKPSDLKYAAGLGLRYATPVGPLRVDYGFKLNRERAESGSEIHFSVGHAF